MFEQLLGLFQGQGAAKPFQGFLGELWEVWAKDAGRAVLFARWYWQNLPADLAQQAAMVQQQAQAAQVSNQIDQQVNAQLGAMGIFGGSGGGMPTGFGMMNPDHAIFITVMGTIRAHRGDPPASHEVAQLAEAVLRGQTDPVNALLAATPAYTRQQAAVAIQTARMMGMDQLFRVQGIIGAASALPRARIPEFVPGLTPQDRGSRTEPESGENVARRWFEAIGAQDLKTVEALSGIPFYDGDGDGQVLRSVRAIRQRYQNPDAKVFRPDQITCTHTDTVAAVRRADWSSVLDRPAAHMELNDENVVVVLKVAFDFSSRLSSEQLKLLPEALRGLSLCFLLKRDAQGFKVCGYW